MSIYYGVLGFVYCEVNGPSTKMSMYACTDYKVAVEGKVIQRAECRPIENAGYMALKRCVQLLI